MTPYRALLYLKNILHLLKSQTASPFGCFENPLLFHFLIISYLWLNDLGSFIRHLSRIPLPSSKTGLRFISFQSPSSPIYAALKILKLNDLIYWDILKIVCKSFNYLSPPYFCIHFQFASTIHFHETRRALAGRIYQFTFYLSKYIFVGSQINKYHGAKLWNDIPLFIKSSTSFDSIKSKLKEFLINSYSICIRDSYNSF